MGRKRSSPVTQLLVWIKGQSMKVKIFLAAMPLLFSLVALTLLVKDHNHFFIASELIHVAGISVLVYKLTTKKTCSGLSLKSQELTAIFLAVRLVCSFMLEGDIHTLLDFATLIFTAWVIFMIRYKLKSTYIKELDNFPIYYMVVPSAILAVLIHPYNTHIYISQVLWAFCVYLEAVSVLPQLRMMQKAKPTMYLHWAWQDSWRALIGSSRFMRLGADIFSWSELGTFGSPWLSLQKLFKPSSWQTFVTITLRVSWRAD
ncbi:putative ER lumen protein-retaining receptor C28H8.4 isoform X2 [Herrania umbratica]|uniref:ER lumen protein-retaining receptor C28H8.4 isoform X2 n=1 Tax=Herrania umbratica TaxID=108875 RepID=A0A6J0ZGY8_9ROSI|nr:putative ER lumen protein-retaining receptor C28H8.4 isoform X2 [Herrania umbratica]